MSNLLLGNLGGKSEFDERFAEFDNLIIGDNLMKLPEVNGIPSNSHKDLPANLSER